MLTLAKEMEKVQLSNMEMFAIVAKTYEFIVKFVISFANLSFSQKLGWIQWQTCQFLFFAKKEQSFSFKPYLTHCN